MTEPDGETTRQERRAQAIVKLAAHRDVKASLVEARAAGVSITEIAKHSGLTRQWVSKLLKAAAADTEETP